MDYSFNLAKAFEPSLYERYMKNRIQDETGLEVNGTFMTCKQNETVKDCPVFNQTY
jgi:hypothetical protein